MNNYNITFYCNCIWVKRYFEQVCSLCTYCFKSLSVNTGYYIIYLSCKCRKEKKDSWLLLDTNKNFYNCVKSNFTLFSQIFLFHFYPRAFKGYQDIAFNHGVWMGGQTFWQVGGGKKLVQGNLFYSFIILAY